jgi:GTP-binding protein
VGLGHEFLRHIERAGILVHLVEPFPSDGTRPLENYHAIRSELAQYNAELVERPEILVLTKCELPDADSVREELSTALSQDVLAISAVTGSGLNRLMERILGAMSQRVAGDAVK